MLLQKVSKVAGIGAVGGFLIVAGASHAAALDTAGVTGPNAYANLSSLVSNYFNSLNSNQITAQTPTNQSANGGSSTYNTNTLGSGSYLGLPGFGLGGGGNASNSSSAVTTVGVSNGSLSGMFGMTSSGMMGNTIGLTGPNSNNVVSNSYNTYFSSTNLNNIFAFTNTNQSANGGSSNNTNNTVAGGGAGGSAMNSSTGLTGVSVNNMGANWSATSNGAVALGGSGIYLTGPNSNNQVNTTSNTVYTSSNTNNVNAQTTTGQTANGGNSTNNTNTIGGSGSAGSASNGSTGGTVVSVTNGQPSVTGGYTSGTYSYGGTIGITGPGSTNIISNSNNSTYTSSNTNNVNASTTTNQGANGGSSNNTNNTVGGGNGAGDAANGSQSGTSVNVQ